MTKVRQRRAPTTRWSSRLLLLSLVGGCVAAPDVAETDGDKADGFFDDECGGRGCLRERDALTQIELFNEGLSAEDRQAKLCKMGTSPFVFFRGTNHLFWLDLAWDPRLSEHGVSEGEGSTRIWLQGDLHVDNYGAFDNDEGEVVYDLNDFDEAVIADYQLDLWRMATSLVLVAEGEGGFDDDLEEILDAFTESYLDTLADLAGSDAEQRTRFTAQTSWGRLDEFLEEVEASSSRREMLDRWTRLDGAGERRFDLAEGRLGPVDEATRQAITEAMAADYLSTLTGGLEPDPAYFRVLDVARRLDAGTGSLGTPRFYVLIEGERDDADDDRILDVKRQGEPTPAHFMGPSRELLGLIESEAHRVTLGQRALGDDVDDHLGWLTLADGAYTVRERSPFKEAFPLDELTSTDRFVAMAEQWGAILAVAHSRADRDFDPSILGYSFDDNVDDVTDGHHDEVRELVRQVAGEYALQVNADYEAFLAELERSALCR